MVLVKKKLDKWRSPNWQWIPILNQNLTNRPICTKFYFQNELFTGIGFIENENQITRISFKNGTIDGHWYDRIIWNQNMTTEGNFVNGVKDGIWKTYYDGELGHTEIYENGVLKNWLNFSI